MNPHSQPGALAGGRVPLVDGARLPLAFIGAGLLALAIAAPWTAWFFRDVARPTFHPEAVALAHLWLPGFLLSVCFGASYQLMPVVLGVPLRARPCAWWGHLVLHAGGVAMLTLGLRGGRYALAGAGGAAILAGALVFAVATLATFRRSNRRDAAAWSFPLAAAWLVATVSAGVLLAANRHAPFFPWPAPDLLKAHAHLGLAGYFLSLLQGVTFQLVPMFTMGVAARPRLAGAGLAATQAGLPVLALGLALDETTVVRLGTACLLAGFVASGIALGCTLRARKRRVLDPGIKAFVLGLIVLGLAAGVGAALVFGGLPPERLPAVAWVYGLGAIGGGLGLAVLGMLAKILPFLVWMKAYGPRVGRETVPAATALASRRLTHLWLAGHAGALPLLMFGVLAEQPAVTAGGAVVLALSLGCYLANAGRVLRHLRQTTALADRRNLAKAPLTTL